MIPRRRVSNLALALCIVTCSFPNWAVSQTSNDLPDSPSEVSRIKHRNDPGSDREVSWKSLPKQLGKGRYWVPTLAVTAGTAGLIYADPHAMPYFRTHARNMDDINDVFDPLITSAEVIAVPVVLLGAGYIRHDSYQVSTALLAGEAYADSAVVDLAMKAVTRRKRPNDVPPGAPFTDTFFSAGKSPFKGSAFPSGHAA